MTRACRTILALACGASLVPAGVRVATAAETQYLRIATLAPRDSDLARGFRKLDAGLRAATHSAWGIRLYPSGVAGDEVDVIRKMKVGQLDASVITSVGLSQIVREIDLLNAPGLIQSYRQLEAIQAAFTPEWESKFESAGFKLLAWGETGQYRWFAKRPISRPSDIKHMRPWLWPQSYGLKEIYRVLGANGVPLAAPEVYGALQTGMVDMVVGTAVVLVSLQWHSNLKHVTERPVGGVLVGAMLMNADRWRVLPPEAQEHVRTELGQNADRDRREMRETDERSYRALVQRGFIADRWDAAAEREYASMADAVRATLTGRVYPADAVARALEIARANR